MTRIWVLLLLLASNALLADETRVEREKLAGPDRIRAERTVDAPLPVVLAALETPCAVRHWLPGADELAVLSHQGPKTRVRMYSRFPWPWKDRLAHLVFERSRRDHQIVITMKAEPVDAEPGTVVVRRSSARWQLDADGEQTRIRYRQRFNPGGTVPQWLADSFAETRVVDALENLAALVENRRTIADCDWTGAAADRQRGQSPGVPQLVRSGEPRPG